MGHNCCRPEVNSQAKYLNLLRLAFNQTANIVTQPLYSNIIKQLNKKGYVKTLYDYLTSHHHRMGHALQYCRTKLNTSKTRKQYIYTVHINTVVSQVCSKIIKLAVQIQLKHHKQNSQNKDIRNTFSKQSSDTFNLNFIIQQFEDIIYDICCESIRQLKNRFQLFIEDDENSEIFVNFNSIISVILSNLVSITSRGGSSVKLNNKNVKNLLELLMQMIYEQQIHKSMGVISPVIKAFKNQKTYTTESINNVNGNGSQELSLHEPWKIQTANKKLSLKAYRNIIRKQQKVLLNSDSYKYLVIQHFPKIISYWATNYQISQKMARRDSVTSQNYNRKVIYEEKLLSPIQEVILLYFNSYFSDNQSEFIYRELVTIFDRLGFSRFKIKPIETLLFQSLNRYDLRDPVIYRWFDYLLNYLAQIGDYIIFLQNILEQCNFVSLRNQHANILKQSNTVGCIYTIQQWMSQGFINVSNIIVYKGKKTMTAILVNLIVGDEILSRAILQILLEIVKKDPKAYVTLIETIYEIIGNVRLKPKSEEKANDQNMRKADRNQQKQDVGNKQVIDFIDQLINIGTKMKFLQLLPGEQILNIINQTTSIIFTRSKIPIFGYRQQQQKYIIKFISRYLGTLRRIVFADYTPFNMKRIAKTFEPLVQYLADFMKQSRNLAQLQKKEDEHIFGMNTLPLEFLNPAFLKEKDNNLLSQKKLNITGISRNSLYVQIIKDLQVWLNLYTGQNKPIKIDNQKLMKKTSSSGMLMQIPSQKSIKKNISQPLISDPEINKKIYSAMSMCLYMIISLISRYLIYEIRQNSRNTITILNLLLLVDACYSQDLKETLESSKKKQSYPLGKKKNPINNNQAKLTEQFVRDIRECIQFILTMDTQKLRRKSHIQYQQNAHKIQNIAMKIIDNTQKILLICDSIGPESWRQYIKKIFEEQENSKSMSASCSWIKNKNSKQEKTQQFDYDSGYTDISRIVDPSQKQNQIFYALKTMYQYYFNRETFKNPNEYNPNINRDQIIIKEQDSVKTDSYGLNGSHHASDSSFNKVLDIIIKE